ncbi:MAG: hypothetical protein DMF61_01920 [Blastocatellia bacterium AA13]|nr:MAG: hypothetical protein DMF61_01920 [Blastocatellia bacterium AA13]
MEPIILIHGYSAESRENDPNEVQQIFGSLPVNLHNLLQQGGADAPIIDINISRYISLDDGVDLDDITLAFDRVLKLDKFKRLLDPQVGFNAIIHSTGALVMRNWLRRCSPKPSPCRRIIHLAGANFGSGWAHIGESLLAKWLRYIGQGGQERGLAVLSGLELGSSWTIDLHRHFLQPGNETLGDYNVMEFSVIGTQPPAKWMIIPFRYGKEDGSDGVVRVSASNLNYNYLRIGPSQPPETIDWDKAAEFASRSVDASTRGDLADFTNSEFFAGGYYEVKEFSLPGENRQYVPFAIPYQCAHSTSEMGIVGGDLPKEDVLKIINLALHCATPVDYKKLIDEFAEITGNTYEQVAHPNHSMSLKGIFDHAKQALENYFESPQSQYDKHAQIIFRIRDQNDKPVRDHSIHFNSFGGATHAELLINALFEDTYSNSVSPNVRTFYLRLERWDKDSAGWKDQLSRVNGLDLEIDSIDAQTDRILFVPLRMRLPGPDLAKYVKPHQTTIIDVQMLRLPSHDTFSMYPNPQAAT